MDIDIDIDVEVDVDIDSYFGWLKGGFKVSSGTVSWYRSSYGADFDDSETASLGLVSTVDDKGLLLYRRFQNPRDSGSIVCIGSCRISIINSKPKSSLCVGSSEFL